MRIRIIKRPPISREHGVEVGDEFAAAWVDQKESPHARVRILSKDSGQGVMLEQAEWEEIK